MSARAPEAVKAKRDEVAVTAVAAEAPPPIPMKMALADHGAAKGAGMGGLGAMSAPRIAPRSAGVTAGSSDDNLQFNAFLQFLRQHPGVALPHDISQRTIVEVRDAQGLPVHRARVSVGGKLVALTYPDGRALVFEPGRIRVRALPAPPVP